MIFVKEVSEWQDLKGFQKNWLSVLFLKRRNFSKKKPKKNDN